MKIETGKVKTKDLLLILSLPKRTFYNLQKQGVFKSVSRGYYDLQASVKSYLDYVRGDSEIGQARTRLVIAQAKGKETANAITDLQLIKSENVQALITEQAAIIVTELEGIPGRVAHELINIKKSAEVRRRLKQEVNRARASIADRFEEIGKVLSDG